MGKVSRAILLIRSNEKPRAELYSSLTFYSQNILIKCKFKITYIKYIKTLINQHCNSADYIKPRESFCYNNLHSFSELQKFLK